MSGQTPKTYEATPEEIKARKKRNMAIAILLVLFVIIVFVTLVSKGIVITYGVGDGEVPDVQ